MARLRNTGRIFMNKLNTFRSVKCTDWNSDPKWIFVGFIGSGLLADWKFSRIPDIWLPYPVSGLIPYRILIKVSDASLILSVSMNVACRVAGAAWNRFFMWSLSRSRRRTRKMTTSRSRSRSRNLNFSGAWAGNVKIVFFRFSYLDCGPEGSLLPDSAARADGGELSEDSGHGLPLHYRAAQAVTVANPLIWRKFWQKQKKTVSIIEEKRCSLTVL